MDVFRVRLNCIDHYQATPTKFDPELRRGVRTSQDSKEPRVPVIRVFGSTETGQKVCAHVHGAFPYLFVEYTESPAPDQVTSYIHRLHLSIDHALAVSYRRDVLREQPRFVVRITLVKAVPFYGFHVGYQFFLKIYVFNPVVMARLADLLQQGLIMNRAFQPYEAHLQFLLQFMADYNLYGCGYIEAGRVSFRSPVPSYSEHDHAWQHAWHEASIPSTMITDDANLPRSSHCPLEVDICVQDILNRLAVKERALHHDFVERLLPLPSDVKLVHSMAGLWKDESDRRRRLLLNCGPGSSPFPPEALVSMSADPRQSQPPGWIHEDEYRDQLRDLVAEEGSLWNTAAVSFDTFVQQKPLSDGVPSLFQSTEDLFPENLSPAVGVNELCEGDDNEDLSSSIIVDERGIFDLGGSLASDDPFPDAPGGDLISESDKASVARTKLLDDEEGGEGINHVLSDAAERQNGHANASTELLQSRETRSSGDVARSVVELPLGVGQSGLRSGHLPRMPLYRELVSEAETQGLLSRGSRGERAKSGLAPLPKRHREADNSQEERKRPRLHRSFDTRELSIADGNIQPPAPQRITEPRRINMPGLSSSQQVNTSSKRDALKRQEGPTLPFVVVKDPDDPSTKLRLSQKPASQHEVDPLQKHVSFDPLFATPGAFTYPERNLAECVTLHPDSSARPGSSAVGPRPSPLKWDSSKTMFSIRAAPPSAADIASTMQQNGLPDAVYQDAFYSNEKDVPTRPREYGGREFRLGGNTAPYLPDFDAACLPVAPTGLPAALQGLATEPGLEQDQPKAVIDCTLKGWEIAEQPPSYQQVKSWWQAKEAARAPGALPQATQPNKSLASQIDGPTPRNKHGFKYSQKQKSASVRYEAQYMSTLSLEVHVNTRGNFVPNPEEDEVQCIFWCVKSDEEFGRGSSSSSSSPVSDASNNTRSGIVVLSEGGCPARRIRSQLAVDVFEETSELDLLLKLVEIVRTFDPDILTGYEVHGGSWGYLIERARFKYDFDLCEEFSRMKSQSSGKFGRDADRWGFNTTSAIRITGRHLINIWRAMRGELNLLQYTMESVVWHLLHRRIPHYSWSTLTGWYSNGRERDLRKVIGYYVNRTRLDIEILERNELIPRVSEQARLLGVDFFSVFSRGSQFKVESIMFRVAKPESFILVSPSRKQIGGQNALECLPLVMEPQSAFYSSPLLVLDFQSLYPSVMIAYNYCYSTFLGRIVNWRGVNKMGFTEYKRQQGLLQLLKDHINIAPNGMMYVKAEIRKSLLAKMLTEILETRVMVKSGMKQDKDDRALQQLLNNRQLALKLLANVTYGYTSASFSGRMPCSEIADSIVQTGRETLERAIAYIHSVDRWGAEVVYGDTDSLFVYLKGRTRDQAFDIGNEIAKAVTDMNPRPIKLKFEKVYHPCVLLAKKRYVGYKYESRDQAKPEFDAKGIETVRRDGTPAEQKMEEKAVRLLFESADLSRVKSYFQAQCDKIMRGAVSVQDFCFAKEVKLGTYSDRGAPPPAALISTKRMLRDARAEPQYGERVPYVVIAGAPGTRLIDRCVPPEELLASPQYALDAEYYISKNIIPPLERIFNLVGANVRQWYDEMPKVQRIRRVDASSVGAKKTLESYLKSASCAVCGLRMQGEGAVCSQCGRDAPRSMAQLQTRLNREEKNLADVVKVCRTCAAFTPVDDVPCDSKDCPVFYSRIRQANRLKAEKASLEPVVSELAALRLGREELDW